ncbi:alpha/beta fold hydrolase [Streptomyces cyaneofuscatus]|uniref:alpha/beta fold hydrolase n=1 Tax=Streptomyces cyaneofuscatus TaxID=66883 RepID=UPI00379A1187
MNLPLSDGHPAYGAESPRALPQPLSWPGPWPPFRCLPPTRRAAWVLTVDGATLHHEVRGEGPLLVMMPGGSADARIHDAIAADLADRWTVATFDPRGYSRSLLDGPVTDQSPATHADDVVRLIDLLSPDGAPAALLGSSSSAVVALEPWPATPAG